MVRILLLGLMAAAAGLAGQANHKNTFAGCLVAPDDSIYNTRIDQLPAHPLSATWAGAVATVGISIGPSWGVNIIDNATPVKKLRFHYATDKDGTKFQIPPPPARYRETGSLTTDGRNDHHMISVNRQSCHIYETYQEGVPGPTWNAASGWDYDGASYFQPHGGDGGGTTDAAGLPLLPLTPRLAEVKAGAIEHAMRFTTCLGCIHAAAPLWPAVGANGSTAPNSPPMGARFRLKAGFDQSHFSPTAQIFLTALKRYGMFLADIGGEMSIQASIDLHQDAAVEPALAEIQAAHILPSNFEVVDEAGLQVAQRSHQVRGAVRPTKRAPQPVLVGLPYSMMTVQAGNHPFGLQSWVNGTSDQRVVWKVEAGPGAVTAAGVYTPPATVSAPTPLTLSVSAAADPGSTEHVWGWVIPAGEIKIDVGGNGPMTNGWLNDSAGITVAAFSRQNDTYPANGWSASLPDVAQTRSYIYTWGDDITWGPYVVANGTYAVTFTMGQGNCVGPVDRKPFDSGLIWGPVMLEGNKVDQQFDWGAAAHYTCRVPSSKTIEVPVSDNLLTVAVRALGSTDTHTAPFMNTIRIVRR